MTAVAGLLILGAASAYADPTETSSGTPTTSESPPAPGSPEQEQPKDAPVTKPDLVLTAAFTQREQPYVEGESFGVTVKIQNDGPADAKATKLSVKSLSGAQFDVTTADWKGVDPNGAGRTVLPKEEVVLDLTAKFKEATAAEGKIEFAAVTPDEGNQGNEVKEVKVNLVPQTTTGTVGGTVYLDEDNSNTYGAGEGVGEVPVTVKGPRGDTRSVKTDANGQFAIPGLPSGVYTVSVPEVLDDGWVTGPASTVIVNGSPDSSKLVIRAKRPLSEALKVTAKFTAGPYKPGDEAKLEITLANEGGLDIDKLVAKKCDLNDLPLTHLEGTDQRLFWGKLAENGEGETIKAGETITRTVRGLVPARAIEEGVVHVYCEFNEKDSQLVGGFPQIFTFAKVPGRNGIVKGKLYEDRDNDGEVDSGEEIKDLTFTLTDPLDNDKVVATTKTAANGDFRIDNTPAGWYIPVFKGPWKQKFNEFISVSVSGDNRQPKPIALVEGPEPGSGPGPTNPPTNNNSSGSSNTSTRALAKTGANVIGLTIGGIAVLVVGVGAVVFSRKRRRS